MLARAVHIARSYVASANFGSSFDPQEMCHCMSYLTALTFQVDALDVEHALV